eukprot:scaffold27501_cov445-Skeletonema_menzelii.AAC.1
MCEVPSPTLGTSLIEYRLSLLIWYSSVRFPPQLWEPPSSNTSCHNNSTTLPIPTSEIKANHCNHDGFQPTSRAL